jgi:mannosyltransferase
MTNYINLDDVEVIAPNFKKRLSGVTSTIIQLVPRQRKLGLNIAVCGAGLPAELPHVRIRDFWKLWFTTKSGDHRIWHARRNIEMLPAIIMRDLLRMKLKIVFTSASQRQHKKYTKWLISKMDSVIATSHKTAKYLEVPNTVIMHGIDLERFCPAKNKQDTKRQLGLDPTKKIAGCFGRIRKQKGTDIFVDTMIEVLPQHENWIAIIAGRTTAEHIDFERSLKSKIDNANLADRILFVGEHTNIENWYQALDLFIAPQRWEGFGLTPLEAGACGVPTIAADVGAFSEIIIENKTGAMTPINDPERMIELTKSYIEDEALLSKHGKHVRHHMETEFSLQKEATAINNTYQETSDSFKG